MANLGDKLGDTIKGVLNAGHGAGDVIRGNFNQAVDNAGEGINRHPDGESNKEHADAKGRSKDYMHAESHNDVAKKGVEDFKQGVGQVTGAFRSSKSAAKEDVENNKSSSTTTDAHSTTTTGSSTL